MPLERAGVGVESEDGVGIEVVPGPLVWIPVRPWIPSPPVRQIEGRIVGAGHPDRAPARLPGVSLPRVVAGLAGSGNGVKAPDFLAGARIMRSHEAADAELAAADADENLVLDDEW